MNQAENQEPDTYTVQKNDTLASISLKFNVSIPWIKQLNGLKDNFIFTGQKLRINNENVLAQISSVEQVSLFGKYPPVIGQLFLKDAYLSFKPYDQSSPLVIDLRGHLESAIMPHPNTNAKILDETLQNPNAPILYVITCIKDEEMSQPETYCFEGFAKDFKDFSKNVILQAEEVQRLLHQASLKRSEITSAAREEDINNDSRSTLNRSLLSDSAPRINPPMPAPMVIGSMPKPMLNQILQKNIVKPLKIIGQSKILVDNDITSMRPFIPLQYRNATWKLLFQLSVHGSSYLTFYEKCMNHYPVVLAIKTNKGDRIGAYISKGFKLSRNFYGNGETFVFSCNPTFQAYKWKNGNQYFVSSSKDEISIGGGGTAAIWIDGDFLHAFSEACSTFGSPTLTQSAQFKIMDVEVWHLSEML